MVLNVIHGGLRIYPWKFKEIEDYCLPTQISYFLTEITRSAPKTV